MAEITLRDYQEQIEDLIDDGRYGEAIAHSRHILEQYPRHIPTYRLLGKALLEQGAVDDAEDIFARVLSAEPDDALAHAGMALVHEKRDDADVALWHLERAFEAEPYNFAIREALRDGYGRRDGRKPEQPPLTPIALARFYVRGQMYDQALQQIQAVSDEVQSRPDVRCLLTEALWRSGRTSDAMAESHEILKQLPYCVRANAILADGLLESDRGAEAEQYLRRVYQLTLFTPSGGTDDTPVATVFGSKLAASLPEEIVLSRLADASVIPPIEESEWVDAVISREDSAEVEADYDWLSAIDADETSMQPAEETPTGDAAPGGPELREHGETESADASESAEVHASRLGDGGTGAVGDDKDDVDVDAWAVAAAAGLAAALEDESEGDAMGAAEENERDFEERPDDDMPEADDSPMPGDQPEDLDWLDELAEADEPASLEGGETADWLQGAIGLESQEDESLDWLDTIEGGETATDDDVVEIPDWLDVESEAVGDDTEISDDEDELSWLDDIAAGEGAAIDELPTMSWADDESDVTPEWLDELTDADEGPADDGPDASPLVEEGHEAVRSDVDSLEEVPADLDEAMAWLENLSGQQGVPPQMLSLEETEYEDADEIPEDLAEAMAWLEEISVAGEGRAPRDEDESGETAPSAVGLSEDEMPGPEAVAEAEEPPEDLDEAMVWLEQLAARQGASADELPSLEEPEAELGAAVDATGEIPDDLEEAIDWLKSLGDEPTATGEATGVTAVVDEGHPASESDDLAWLDDLESEHAPEPEGHDDWDEAPVGAGAPDLADDLDEAIAWLEQLATEDAISLDELEGERTGQAFGAEAYVGLEQLPDDPEEALAWLEGLASEPAQPSIEADVVAATPTPPVPHDVVAARAEAEASIAQGEQDDAEASLPGPGEEILDEMPEDPDEAMAWLEQLAARQGASLDELPTVEEVDEEAAMPSWLAREVERARDLEDEDVSVDVAPIDDLTESDEAFLEHEFDSAVADEGEELLEELGVEFDEDFEDALPDWLVFDDEDDKVAEVEWVEPDASITSWLEAEDELAVADAERELLDVGPEDVIADEVLPEERVYEEFTAADETGAAETPTAEIGAPTSPERDLAEYEAKIEAGEELVEIIDELEGRLATQGPDALLSRMLGDAYMRNGQLQRALEAYRGALKHL